MPWWTNALYDTCSLITLDKMLLDHPEIAVHFQGVLAIEASFRVDQLRSDTARRMQPRVTYMEMPATPVLARVLAAARLPQSLAQVDKLVFVTAVQHGLTVITGDKRLAQSVARRGLRVGNIALVLKTLVGRQMLSEAACNTLLADLAQRHDFILPVTRPQTWATLRQYTFP
jgi:hypothetical protein